jgi:hypothetical protein
VTSSSVPLGAPAPSVGGNRTVRGEWRGARVALRGRCVVDSPAVRRLSSQRGRRSAGSPGPERSVAGRARSSHAGVAGAGRL